MRSNRTGRLAALLIALTWMTAWGASVPTAENHRTDSVNRHAGRSVAQLPVLHDKTFRGEARLCRRRILRRGSCGGIFGRGRPDGDDRSGRSLPIQDARDRAPARNPRGNSTEQ